MLFIFLFLFIDLVQKILIIRNLVYKVNIIGVEVIYVYNIYFVIMCEGCKLLRIYVKFFISKFYCIIYIYSRFFY